MMGFWNGLAKVVQGRPVFEVQGTHDTLPRASDEPSDRDTVNDSGQKIIPEVTFEHCESHLRGSEMDVTVWVTNTSRVQIELDKITMLGQTAELDRYLEPGEARELRLFKGKVPTSDSYHTANLYYKQVNSGDYFCADFLIEYDYDVDGFYTVEEFQPIRPVRDV